MGIRGVWAGRASVVVLAAVALLFAFMPALAFAASTYYDQYPAAGGVSTEPMPRLSVKVSDPAGISGGYQLKLDGVTRSVKTKWGTGNAFVELYFQLPSALANGAHTVYASVLTGAGRTSSTWTFTQKVPPTLGPLTPADGATVDTQTPTISAVVGTNGSSLSSYTMTVDSQGVIPTYDSATKTVSYTPATKLTNGKNHTVSLTVVDSSGASASVSWAFLVQTLADMTDTQGCTDCHKTFPAAHPMTNCEGCHAPDAPFPAYWNMDDRTPHGVSYLADVDCAYCHSSMFAKVPSHPADISGLHTVDATMAGCSCHVRNLTVEHNRYLDSNGNQFTCATCHESTDPQIVAGMAAGTRKCPDCHTIPSGHPYAEIDHVADVGDTADLSGLKCSECHEMSLLSEHEKASSSSTGRACDNCHDTPRDSITTWNQTCSQGGCHAAGSATQMHGNLASAHEGDLPAGCADTNCHSGTNLMTIHAKASITTVNGEKKSCMVCHASGVPTKDACKDCHDMLAPHGNLDTIHTGVMTSGAVSVWDNHQEVLGGVYSGYIGRVDKTLACVTCHPTTNLLRMHGSTWDNCGQCHGDDKPRASFGTWDKGCQQGDCHSASLHNLPKVQASHKAQSCWSRWGGCHSDGLETSYCSSRCHEHAATVRGDATAPVTALTTAEPLMNGYAWFAGDTHVTLTASDAGSGSYAVSYRINGGEWVSTLGSRATFTVTQSGKSTVEYYSRDRLGNQEAFKSYQIGIDRVAATTKSSASYLGANVWGLTATDDTAAGTGGVKAIYYSIDGGAYSAINASYRSPAYTSIWGNATGPSDSRGPHTIRYYSVDNVGNVEAEKTLSYTMPDPAAPYSSFWQDPTYQTSKVYATDTNSGALTSGIKTIYYRYARTGAWKQVDFPDDNRTATRSVALTDSPEGAYAFQYYTVDHGGNAGPVSDATVTTDRYTAPVVSIYKLRSNADGSVDVRITASTGYSGLNDLGYEVAAANGEFGWSSGGNGSPTDINIPAPLWGSTTATVTATAVDRAGHKSATVSAVFTTTNKLPDLLAPESWAGIDDGSQVMSVDGNYELWIGAWDDHSGVARTYYRIDGGDWLSSTIDPRVGEFAVTVAGYGAHTLDYYSVDNVGHAEAMLSTSFEVVPAAKIALTMHNTTYSQATWLDADYSYDAIVYDMWGNVIDEWSGRTRNDDGNRVPQTRSYTWNPTPEEPWRVEVTIHTQNEGDQTYEIENIVFGPGETYTTAGLYADSFAGLDVTPPVTTNDLKPEYVGDAVITWATTDEGGSGVGLPYVELDGLWYDEDWPMTIPAPTSGVETHTLRWWATDGEGNAEVPQESTFSIYADGWTPVTFGDPDLEAAVRDSLGITVTRSVSQPEMLQLTELTANDAGITSLEGLQHATNLGSISMHNNEISDLTPLSCLTELTYLGMSNNNISDLSPLSGLSNLNELWLRENHVSDLAPLAGLTNLKQLSVNYNDVSDISPIVGLTSLEGLFVCGSPLSDISPLIPMMDAGAPLTSLYVMEDYLDLREGSAARAVVDELSARGVEVSLDSQHHIALMASAATGVDSPVTITLSAVDEWGMEVTDGDWAIATGPTRGVVDVVGGVATYTPESGFAGTDSFTVTFEDANGVSLPATIAIEVN